MSLSAIPKALRKRVFERDGGRCQYCMLAQVGQAAVFHINHVIPKSRGGETVEANLAVQCPYCSLHKSNQITVADPESGQIIPLFHPVSQRWSEHFALSRDGLCRGLTPIGRATERP